MTDRLTGIACISLGANLGDATRNLTSAAEMISDIIAVGSSARGSSIWLSQPEEFAEAVPDFYNAVIALQTRLSPEVLLQRLLSVENEFGRVRGKPGVRESRALDLDIVDFAGCIHRSACLTLPHPGAHARRFVLLPLQELAPDFRFPDRDETLEQLIQAAPANHMEAIGPLIP